MIEICIHFEERPQVDAMVPPGWYPRWHDRARVGSEQTGAETALESAC